jgi:hypothetical protein
VGSRTYLDYVERRKILPLPGLELRPLGRPARSQSLYRLRYPGYFSHTELNLNKMYGEFMGYRENLIYGLTQSRLCCVSIQLM